MTEEKERDVSDNSEASEEASIEGRFTRTPASPGWEFLRLVTGWAALVWLANLVGWLLGYRHAVRLDLSPEAIRVRRERRLLGRVIRESRETWTRRALASVGQRVYQSALQLYVGSLMLALGVLIGGVYFVDGVRTGETYLLLVGAGAILIGGGLDFAMHVWLPTSRSQVVVDLRMLPRHALSIQGLTERDAGRFVDAVGMAPKEA